MHTPANQRVPQLLMKQSDTLPAQCSRIEHLHEDVWWQKLIIDKMTVCKFSHFRYWPVLCGGRGGGSLISSAYSHFCQELWGLEGWNLVHTWTVDSGQLYRVYWNQAAATSYSSLYSFFFLSNFQTLKYFITAFSGTVRPRSLKICTHVYSEQMYRVYWN